MSLRARLLLALLAALLISATLGACLAAWSARRVTAAEMKASLANARASAAAVLNDLPQAPDAVADALRRTVHALDGSRHLQAELLSPDGAVLDRSAPQPGRAPPPWFVAAVAGPPARVRLPAPGGDALLLTTAPGSEAGERWTEMRHGALDFAAFSAVAAVLCSLTLRRGLRPLDALTGALARAGRGEAKPDLPERGPPELAALARTFNATARALNAAEARNAALTRQIATIAEEERAEIARDLHDEIGPLLFAITTYAAAIARQAEGGDVPAQAKAIQDAVARLQTQVREMLGRLHDAPQAPADLATALGGLLEFWRGIRPGCEFGLRADALPPLPEAARECLFRAAQEGISNAIRHGRPAVVRVTLAADAACVRLDVADDGAGGQEKPGHGLAGMRARAAALGGDVRLTTGAGWTVSVRLPLAAMREAAPA